MTIAHYVSTADVAARFNVSSSTIMSMIRTGELPVGSYLRIGRVYRFDLERIESELLKRAAVKAEPPVEAQLGFDFDPNETEE
jgi:excisionase family DNA binding protein